MIVTEIIGNRHDLSEEELSTVTQDFLSLGNLELVKRIFRGHTEAGEEIGLRLPPSSPELRDGDILARDNERIIFVRVKPTDVLVIQPESIEEMGRVAHNLGNRHLQAQFFGADTEYGRGVMVVQYDHTVEDFLKHVGVNYVREDHVMPRAFRHAEHTH